MEAIVLAGGQGTRLRSVVADVPKPMAPIGARPFLSYVMEYLIAQGVEHIILATGYMHEVIESYYGASYQNAALTYSIEREPLGTGGGILQASRYAKTDDVCIVNGDTIFPVNLQSLVAVHTANQADITMSLKKMVDFDRYGVVRTAASRVIGFESKRYVQTGFINGGIYMMNIRSLQALRLPERFSFEADLLERYVAELRMYAYESDASFIDIGVPEDYRLAQAVL